MTPTHQLFTHSRTFGRRHSFHLYLLFGALWAGVSFGQSAETDFQNDEVIELEALVVTPLLEERNRSIAAKQNAASIGDFISSDRLGQFVDDDIGEIVERLPGVYTSGAGQSGGSGISVRGLRGDFNALQVNSARLPSNQGQSRGVSIDTIPAELIGEIEVFKAVTPDREADSIGGLVNVITKSGLDFNDRFISGNLAYGVHELGNTDQMRATLNYADRLTDKLGIFVGISYRDEDGTRRDEYDLDPGDWLFDQMVATDIDEEIDEDTAEQVFSFGRTTARRTLQSQTNLGATINLDYQAAEDMRLFFRSFYSKFDEERSQRRLLYRFDRSDGDDPDGEEFGDGDFVYREGEVLYFGDDQRMRKRVHEQEEEEVIQSYQLGLDKFFDSGQLTASVSYSLSDRDLINDQYLWEADDVPMWADFTDRRRPRFGVPQEGDPYYDDGFTETGLFDPEWFDGDDDGYFLASSRRGELIDAKDRIQQYKVDYQHFLNPEVGTAWVKVGTLYRIQDKENQRDYVIDEDGFNWDPNAAGVEYDMIDNWYGGSADMGIFPSYATMNAQGNLAPNEFIRSTLINKPRPDDLAESIGQDFEIEESVWGTYVMGSWQFDRWTVLGGVRYERTKNDFKGYIVDGALGIVPDFDDPTYDIDGSRSYDGIYPSLHVNYQLTNQLLVRGSVGRTLARPSFQDLFPSAFIRWDSESEEDPDDPRDIHITRGNTDLDPTESTNVDVSLEYYFERGGLVSVALFYKDIENWIYEDTSIYDRSEFPEYDGLPNPGVVIVESMQNGDAAELRGVEFNIDVPIAYGFSARANYTLIDIDVDEEEVGLDRIPGQAESLLNLSLAYENTWLTTRLSYRRTSEIVDSRITFSDDAAVDLFGSDSLGIFEGESERLNLSVDIRATENWTFFARWRNITSEDSYEYVDNNKLFPVNMERRGHDLLAGVKFKF